VPLTGKKTIHLPQKNTKDLTGIGITKVHEKKRRENEFSDTIRRE
jgi:hypothetical protein